MISPLVFDAVQSQRVSTWEVRLDRVRTAVGGWRERLPNPDPIEPRSSLAGDDAAHPRMPCSQLAWWGLNVGVEHLDAGIRLLDQQVSTGGPILPTANFTVLRGGLVGSSQAVTLLGPRRREERTTYALQIAHEEYRQAYNFRERVINHPGLVDEARESASKKDYLAGLREARDGAADILKSRGSSVRLTDTAMIERAAQLVHADPDDADLLRSSVEMEWALGSGAAHGRMLMTMHREAGFRAEEDGMALFGSSYKSVVMPIVGVFLILNEGWRLWDLRRGA